MNKYRIHLGLMSGKMVYSDPMEIGKMDRQEVTETLDKMMEIVGDGGHLSLLVNGQKKMYLNHAIESVWWTDGS